MLKHELGHPGEIISDDTQDIKSSRLVRWWSPLRSIVRRMWGDTKWNVHREVCLEGRELAYTSELYNILKRAIEEWGCLNS